jgi:glycosyltransferase involved in cell wall biosynthesis
MRILFLNPLGELGGAELSMLDLIASLLAAHRGLQVGMIAGAEGPLVERARELGAEVSVAPLPSKLSLIGDHCASGATVGDHTIAALAAKLSAAIPATAGYAALLRRRIAAFRPDLIHTNGFKMHVLGVWAAPRRVPVVWHIRDYVSRRPMMSKLMRAHVGGAASAIAISRSVAEDLGRACNSRLNVTHVYDGIDLERFSPDGPKADLDSLSAMPPANPETVRVGLVATMARWKGHEVFLRAMSFLRPSLPIRAYIIGGPVYSTVGSQTSIDELRHIAHECGVAGRVGFTGFVADPGSAMRALDVVVHASTEAEPLGRVIVEAMACRRPVIASDAGGASELINHDVDALAFRPGDVAMLTRRIRDLASDRAMRARLGAAGHAKARQSFDRARLASEVVPVYLAATARRGAVDYVHEQA